VYFVHFSGRRLFAEEMQTKSLVNAKVSAWQQCVYEGP